VWGDGVQESKVSSKQVIPILSNGVWVCD